MPSCLSHPLVYLASIDHLFPHFLSAVVCCFRRALAHLLQPPSFPTSCSSPVGRLHSSILSSSSLCPPTTMGQAWRSGTTPTAAAEPLWSLLPSTSHCSCLPITKKSKEQMSSYSCLWSFYISFACHSKLLFLTIDPRCFLFSLCLSVSLSLHTHCLLSNLKVMFLSDWLLTVSGKWMIFFLSFPTPQHVNFQFITSFCCNSLTNSPI